MINEKYSLKIIILLTPIFSLFLPTWSAPGGLGFCFFDCYNDPKIVQNEASAYISSFLKASQAFFSEYGKLPNTSKDIGKYINVSGCKKNNRRFCLNSAVENYSDSAITKWYLPSGSNEIEMKSENEQNIFIAIPTGKFKKKGLAVSGCFNSKNGKTNILKMDTDLQSEEPP